jgi:uncharacterized iron-regulated protein
MENPPNHRTFRLPGVCLGLMLVALMALPCRAEVLAARAVDLHALPTLQQILPALADKRVVFVGESHDQYGHHLVQLAIIRALHAQHGDIAIGLEFFQQPFQEHLDAFVAGEIDERTMLQRTQYMDRWGFDYRLYQPILQYARDNRLPLIALNVPKELTRKVAEGGVAKLSAEERAQLPEMERGEERYRQRLRTLYETHPVREGGTFENFLEAQLLWDEGMAARAAEYMKQHPDRRMVILAGAGHVAWRDGIPRRLERRTGAPSAVVLNGPQEVVSPEVADFVVLPERVELSPKGMLGVLMENAEPGVRISGFSKTSAAQDAGVKQDDRIVQIDDESVANTTDVQLAMFSRKPGEVVNLGVLRQAGTAQEQLLRYPIKLR